VSSLYVASQKRRPKAEMLTVELAHYQSIYASSGWTASIQSPRLSQCRVGYDQSGRQSLRFILHLWPHSRSSVDIILTTIPPHALSYSDSGQIESLSVCWAKSTTSYHYTNLLREFAASVGTVDLTDIPATALDPTR
jgi:hypothetical protein